MREHHPSEADAAIRRHLMQRQPEGYRDLAKKFLLDLPRIDPDAILKADHGPGVRTWWDDIRKDIIVEVNGASYTFESAVQAGIVKPGRRK